MLRFLSGADLRRCPGLAEALFRDRQRWDADGGLGRDAYDALNPLHVIWLGPDGGHAGSVRLLPTLGPTMVGDHYRHLCGGRRLAHAKVWEGSRFCLSAPADPRAAAGALLGVAELGVGLGLARVTMLFDARMTGLFRQVGWKPTVLGADDAGAGQPGLGLWELSEATRRRLATCAGVHPDQSRAWFDADFARKSPSTAAG